jgi:HlyD family secretion protein
MSSNTVVGRAWPRWASRPVVVIGLIIALVAGLGAIALRYQANGLLAVWNSAREPAGSTAESPAAGAASGERSAGHSPAAGNRPQTALTRVYALGRLEPRGTVIRIAPPSGNEGARVDQLLVAEGDTVTTGQLLAVLDVAARRAAAVDEAAARLAVAAARLEQTRAGAKPGDIEAQAATVARMDAELEMAEKELERMADLAAKQVAPLEQLELKQLAVKRTRHEISRARAQLESLKEVRAVDVALQQAEVVSAEASLAKARADHDAAYVRSCCVGRILKIHARPGEKVGDNSILQLGDVAAMQAVAEVFEGDLERVHIGQRATIQLPDRHLECHGRVVEIGWMVARKNVLSNDPVSDTDARVVEVRIALDPEDIDRVAGLSNARIEVAIDSEVVETLPESSAGEHNASRPSLPRDAASP